MQLTAGSEPSIRAQIERAAPLTLEKLTLAVPEPRSGETLILDIPALQIPAGQSVGIAGPSGAGKTSLLHIIAGLLRPSTGSVSWGAHSVSLRSEEARDRWRRNTAGLVFQDFALVPELGVLDNILLPVSFTRWRVPFAIRQEAAALAKRLGVTMLASRVASLSRGEQQRVAVARALLGNPALLLADEPTASLDHENGAAVAALLVECARAIGATLIAVSHDASLLARLDRVIRLESGRIVEDGAP